MIDTERLDTIFRDCLCTAEELAAAQPGTPQYVPFEGIRFSGGFHPARLEAHREELQQLIDQLPASLDQGLSFLALCMDRDNYQWGEHSHVEQLVTLGTATKQLRYVMPRRLWDAMPGGLPYVIRGTDATHT